MREVRTSGLLKGKSYHILRPQIAPKGSLQGVRSRGVGLYSTLVLFGR